MKILFVTPSYEPGRVFGGTVTAVSQLCRGLAKNGVDITVYTTDADGKGGHLDVPLNKLVDLKGVKVWYFHCNFGYQKAFYSSSLIKNFNETVKEFDLIHAAAIWQWFQVPISKYCKSLNIPYVVSPHGSLMSWGLGRKRWKRLLYWYLFARPALLKAQAIHYVSESEKEESQKNFKNSVPSFIVPNCINSEYFIPDKEKVKEFRDSLNIPLSAFVISFLALIRPRKGLDLLIKALSYLKNENIFLLIGGATENEEYFRKLKKMTEDYNLDSRVKWLGLIKSEDLTSFYAASDLFILPSLEEAFGMVVIEAMACGTPVLISKKVPIWREVIADKAGLTIELSPQDIAATIKKLLLNPSLLNLFSENTRQAVKNRYDIKKAASLMKRAYEDILTERRTPELKWK